MIPNGTGYLLDYACGGGQRKWCESKGYKYIGIDYMLIEEEPLRYSSGFNYVDSK